MLWPDSADRDEHGQLRIGGVPVAQLAREYGTPLYVYDETTIRAQCRRYLGALGAEYSRPVVTYAGKAGLNRALLQIIKEEGLALDVVSGGELHVALWAGFPAERIHLHGNNKSRDELQMALDAGVGAIVIDNFSEIELLAELTAGRREPFPVLLRLNPGIDVHTHAYRKTGILDSKFGLSIETGDAERAVERILALPGLRFEGYHAHIGSQIFEVEPFVATVDALFSFAARMRDRFGIIPEEIAPGGGFGIQYAADDPDQPADGYAVAVARAAVAAAERFDFPEPRLTIEPGRSIIGRAGVAVYTLGAVKEISGVRTYVSVDGGMADNIRPALYGAVYSAELVSRPTTGTCQPVTIAGKFCESGDVLIDRIELPPFGQGEWLAVPAAGAYSLAMASNYNMALRPAVVIVQDGSAQLVQRRETFDDLVARDVAP